MEIISLISWFPSHFGMIGEKNSYPTCFVPENTEDPIRNKLVILKQACRVGEGNEG